MNAPIALFAGDVTQDSTFRIPHVPGADEKVTATGFAGAVGGMAVNAAIACHRGGTAARLLVRVAGDPASAACLDDIAAEGVTVLAATTGSGTARVTVLLAPDGEKRLVLYPGDSMYPDLEQARGVALDEIAWVHHAVYDVEAAGELVARSRRAGIPWSLDLEPSTFASGIEALAPCLDGADTVFCNPASLAAIGAQPVARLFSLGVNRLVETRGAAGASLLHAGQAQPSPLAAPTVEAVDTTGAGDCLAGRYIAARLRSLDPLDALREAIDAASEACRRQGSWISYPRYTNAHERTTTTG